MHFPYLSMMPQAQTTREGGAIATDLPFALNNPDDRASG
jgi:hypothetical protein